MEVEDQVNSEEVRRVSRKETCVANCTWWEEEEVQDKWTPDEELVVWGEFLETWTSIQPRFQKQVEVTEDPMGHPFYYVTLSLSRHSNYVTTVI